MGTKHDHGLQIAVLDRGWVIVGHCYTDDDFLYIEDARNVRIWGTTKGLGELASNGPLAATKIDDMPPVKVSRKAHLFLVECNAAKWKRCNCGHGDHA